MKTKISISIVLFLFSLNSFAQIPSDALKFTQTFNGGTARFVSMGGAFGALGGDFSSLSLNPAGLGVYRTSEFTFTPSFKSRTVSSDYNGSNGKDTRNKLNFDNIGFVLSFKPNGDSQTGLVNFNLAFGYNNTNDFNTYAYARGNNSSNSIMDYFAKQAKNSDSYDMTFPSDVNDPYNPYLDSNAPWEAIMAWNTFLIDTVTGNNLNYNPLKYGGNLLQRNKISSSGSTGEYVMSLGLNFNNNLFIGASLNATNLKYSSSSTFSEDSLSNTSIPNIDKFNYLDYKQTLETNGTGYNLKIGVIYKPIDGLRLGFTLHTPTYFSLQDTYSYSLEADSKFGNWSSNTPNSRYDYHLETPFKTIGSAAYVFKDKGLISLDVERINYSTMRFRDGGDGYDYSQENDAIKNTYKNVTNIRVGGEYRINDIFLRGGYAFYPSPYKTGFLNENANRSLISGGIGYRSGTFFVDATYLYSIQNEKYVFYQSSDNSVYTDPVSTKLTEGKVIVTVGFKF
jgi:hypothetical protein